MTKRLIAMLVVLAAACATSPVPIADASPTPAERIYYAAQEGKEFATAVFVRDTGFVGAGVYQHLTINDERAASIDVGEKATLRLSPGEYVLAVKPTDMFGASAPFAIDQKLEAGKTYYYRILTDGNTMSTRIQRMIGKSGN